MDRRRQNQFVRFLAVGLLNTAFGYGVYALLVFVGLPAQAALIGQFVAGATWNYFTHARLVFGTRGTGRMPAYFGAYLLVYAVNALLLRLLMGLGLGAYLAQALLLPVTVVLAFLLISRVLDGPDRAAQQP
ncbi:GtrA family protein [Oceanomicrobium pacificus]|uniref:GtrA/DPMS transmembrane domain-containing protein n=1 Tax=Oceanomicrobium pacificus TaxID=2692916 RepID=A0A6B0TU93_9RHOB|nr:GtrA family protein [Oceanomicrobium pacificus]MXU65218.1 hypothetical protein [Oceanomicrobium pacificus]